MQLDLFEIDELIQEINMNTFDDAQRIIEEIDFEEKRKKVIEWIIGEKVNVLIAFSGGKDSVAMALYLHQELKIPKERIELWHHEVDGRGEALFDWPCTKSYCLAFVKAFGFKLLFSYREGGIVREIFRKNETMQDVYFQDKADGEFLLAESQKKDRFFNTRLKFPAVSADLRTRWCSSTVKIEVMAKAINHQQRFKESELLICTGERRAESVARSKYQEIEPYKSFTKTRRAILWRPLIDWTDKEVWAILEKYKVQPHPAYELGWSRCSCQTCIFNSENTWASLKEISQEKIDRIGEIEEEIGFTLYPDTTIEEKASAGTSFIEDQDRYWIKQATGEFTAPIITNHWKVPKGAKSLERTGAL